MRLASNRGEEWDVIPGHSDYWISSHGRVYNNATETYSYGSDNGKGYKKIRIVSDEGVNSLVYVHQLVAYIFIEDYEIDHGPRLRHIDNNPSNNKLSNLEMIGAFRGKGNRYVPEYRGGRLVKIVETGEIFANVSALASYLQTDPSTIYKCLRHERDTHLGYTYEYVGRA